MSSPAPLLKITALTKRYDTGSVEVPVLNTVSLELNGGESLAIVGPSGSGKSTLLQIIGTLEQPTSGQVTLNGRDLGSLNDQQLAQVRNQEIGFVFQSHYLLPQCTAWENVLVPTLAGNPGHQGDSSTTAPAESAEDRAKRLFDRVGLADRTTHFPGQLSGGERQRVAVVRALINQPQLLLADEPTGALDQHAADALGTLMVELNKEEKVTLVVVTHSMDLANRMQQVMKLESGRLA